MKISTQEFTINKNEAESRYYTISLYQEFTDDENCYRLNKNGDKVFAKAIKEGLSRNINNLEPFQFKYYVRKHTGNKLFDPFPKYSMNDNKSSFLDRICKDDQQFIEVTKIAFDQYITFLNTQSKQHLISAQREIM
jgi:hypothetical protein